MEWKGTDEGSYEKSWEGIAQKVLSETQSQISMSHFDYNV